MPILQHEPGTDLDFKPHVFLSFGKVQFQQTKVKNKCQNSRLVQTKLTLVCKCSARDRDTPRFQTPRFSEFWQSTIPANEGKKQMPKLTARANQMLIGVPSLKHETGTDLDFKPHVFLSFGKVQFQQT